jgi:multiple sugar transport system ATP-binding protein
VELGDYLARKPAALSGGQRQRVALARAIVRTPKLFLMDEPLSNLDAALRGQVRAELVRLHRKFGITTVYVTHDQVEAMTMASQIAIMSRGRLQQAGTPQDVFDNPRNQTVATFIGSPPMNILPGALRIEAGRLVVRVLGHDLALPAWASLIEARGLPGKLNIGIRATDIAVEPSAFGPRGEITFVESLGAETYLSVQCEGANVLCRAPGRMRLHPGEIISMSFDPEFLYAFDAETGNALLDRSARKLAGAEEMRQREPLQHSERESTS